MIDATETNGIKVGDSVILVNSTKCCKKMSPAVGRVRKIVSIDGRHEATCKHCRARVLVTRATTNTGGRIALHAWIPLPDLDTKKEEEEANKKTLHKLVGISANVSLRNGKIVDIEIIERPIFKEIVK